MPKLSREKREKLRQEIRKFIEESSLARGVQSKLAERYGVSRSYVFQIVSDERKRFINPISWEWVRARRSGEKINLAKLVESLRNHPALQTHG